MTGFDTMSDRDLRRYVLEHRDDKEAFQILVNRAKAKPGPWYSRDQLYQLEEIVNAEPQREHDPEL